MSKATNLRLLLTAVAAAVSTSVSAQGLAQLPGAAPQPAAAGAAAAAAARAPAVRTQNVAPQAAQPVEEEIRPRNPLEEISRLNAEIATLKAKLQATDLKAQIKKKEEELNPPPKVEKKEEPKVSKKEESPKPNLPPLPNLNALLPPGAPTTGPAPSAAGSNQQQGQSKPAPRMDPQLLAIEGVGDNLRAELMTDWGGWAEVGVGDKYYDYKVEEIKLSSVLLSKGQTRVNLAITNSRVNRLQTQAAMSRSMPSAASGGVPVPVDGGPMGAMGAAMGGAISVGAPNGALTTTGLPPNPVGPALVPGDVPLQGISRPPANLGVDGVKGGPPAKSPF